MNILRFPHINAVGIKFDVAIKLVGQGQPWFIICANLVGPTSTMLHTKANGLLVLEKIFKEFLPYMGVVAILVL